MKHVRLLNGLRVAYQEWGMANSGIPGKRVIALHGWLDNSNSFKILGPLLAAQGYHVVAVDILGHGRSDHLGVGAVYSILNGTALVREFITGLGWNEPIAPSTADVATTTTSSAADTPPGTYTLVGHSMGASIAMIYSATFHENVSKVIFLDGFGPTVEKDVNMTPNSFRKAADAEYSLKKRNSTDTRGPKLYKTFTEAVQARIQTVKLFPGEQYIAPESAEAMVARGTKVAGTENSPEYEDIVSSTAGPLQFTHDPRLVLPSYVYHSEEQVSY